MNWMLLIAGVSVAAACLAVVLARLMRSPRPRTILRRRPPARPAYPH